MKKLGIVGCGTISDLLLAGASQAGLELAAVCDVDRSKAERRALPFGAKVYTDYDGLLADPAVDGVIVALPNDMHFEPAVRALDAGKHVFCEKPMTIRVDDSRKLVEKVKASGLVFQVGYMKRFNAAFRAVKEALPKLAPVSAASMRLTVTVPVFLDAPPPGKPSSWIGDIERTGGGLLVHSGSHMLELMMHLFGVPKSVSGHLVRDKNRSEYINNFLFRMADGMCCHLQLCATRAKGFGHARSMWEERLDVVGVNGKAVAETSDWQGTVNPTATIALADEDAAREVFTFGKSQWADELVAFVKGMEEGRCMGSTVVDGYRTDYLLAELKKLEGATEAVLPLEFEY